MVEHIYFSLIPPHYYRIGYKYAFSDGFDSIYFLLFSKFRDIKFA